MSNTGAYSSKGLGRGPLHPASKKAPAILPLVMNDAPSSPSSPQVLGRFFTVAEVARQLRVSNMTVYRLIKSGQLPAVRVGRGYRMRDDDVRKYLNERYMDAG